MEKRKRRSKKQKAADWAQTLEAIRNKPEELRSPVEKYWLEHANDEPLKLNMRYVLR